LGDRLPEVARRYRKSREQLEELFLSNKDLWLDPSENLLYTCSHLPQEVDPENAFGETTQNAVVPYDQTFLLHSQGGATKVIYLDFDGHTTTGTIWDGGGTIVSLPYDIDNDTSFFSNTELDRIQNIWARVAEDFIIYNVDVTTEDPGVEALRRSNPADEYYGIRAVISPSSSWFGYYGGVAYVGSFTWNSDTPTFIFSDNLGNGAEKYVSDAASHEVGHTLGLYHDGGGGDGEYYYGHGQWAPIMGVGYYQPITQWSKGEYPGANNKEDDLAIMPLVGGFDYRVDDSGNSIGSAKPLADNVNINAAGIIERNTDADVFSFNTGSGDITISVDPAQPKGNLDILLELLNPDGGVIAGVDEFTIGTESLSANVSGGIYYIRIDGVGDVDYSDYASLGQYTLYGAIIDADGTNAAPTFTSDPIVEADAALGAPYSSSIADNAADPEDDPLTFSKVAGPAWLIVASDGALSGTPADSDIGINNWTVEVNDSNGGMDQATLEILVFDPTAPVEDVANGETTVIGTLVSGSYMSTQTSNNVYEVIREIESGGRPNKRRSYLEHKWMVNVIGGDTITFFVEAYHNLNAEGDDFIFAYSTDDINYINMLTVSKTDDDNTYQSFVLPSSIQGTVYIRVTDSDRTKGNRSLDTIYVDELFIRSKRDGGSSCTPADCHIQSVISGTVAASKGKKFGYVTVSVFDNCGNIVAGANVTGTFTGSYGETLVATTDASGIAKFTTSTQIKKPTYTFCVDGVVHSGLSYNFDDNIVTCSSY
jgi:hypothetical protein